MKAKRKHTKKSRRSHRAYRKNPPRTVADPHAARELALCYDNERANQNQKESIINNLARKMAKGVYNKAGAVKLWGYAAKSGADAYAKAFGSSGDTGSKMFNAATRAMAAGIMEDENREYVKERSERFIPKPKAKRVKRNPGGPKRISRDELYAHNKSARIAKAHTLYNAAMNADKAYTAALKAQFGRRATEARYSYALKKAYNTATKKAVTRARRAILVYTGFIKKHHGF